MTQNDECMGRVFDDRTVYLVEALAKQLGYADDKELRDMIAGTVAGFPDDQPRLRAVQIDEKTFVTGKDFCLYFLYISRLREDGLGTSVEDDDE